MVASLSLLGIDLQWADNQYWTTLMKVMGDIIKIKKPRKREKVSANSIGKFIRD